MLKVLKSCLVLLSSIILLSTSVHAASREEYISYHEDRMIDLCCDIYGDRDGVYGCLITEYFAIRKVSEILTTMRPPGEDWDILSGLFIENYWPEYDTYDFMVIHLEFEEYLEGKENSE
jgi:hypothetical protein